MVCNTQSQRMSLNPVSPEKNFESQMRFASASEKSQLGSLVSWVGHIPVHSLAVSQVVQLAGYGLYECFNASFFVFRSDLINR